MSILTGPMGGGWKGGPRPNDDKYDGKHGRKDDHDWKSKDDRHDDKDGGKHGRKDDHDWKSKDDKYDDKHDGKHGRKDDDHDWKSKDDKHDKHARKDDDCSDNDNGHQDDCEPVCCDPEPDCDVHAALVGMSDVGSVVDFAIDALSPDQGMDMGNFDMGGAHDSLGA